MAILSISWRLLLKEIVSKEPVTNQPIGAILVKPKGHPKKVINISLTE